MEAAEELLRSFLDNGRQDRERFESIALRSAVAISDRDYEQHQRIIDEYTGSLLAEFRRESPDGGTEGEEAGTADGTDRETMDETSNGDEPSESGSGEPVRPAEGVGQ